MSEQSLHAPSRTTRPRVQKSITATLAADILNGRFKPGSMLPRENDLCEEYGVSRTVIRETIKTLESKGLVRGKPRIGTVVCEQDEWNLLDQQVLDWLGPRIVDLDLLLCVLEARRAIEPVAAELATQRAGFRKGNTPEQGIKRRHFHFNAFRSHKRGIGVAHFADGDIAERSTKDRKETHAWWLADFDALHQLRLSIM